MHSTESPPCTTPRLLLLTGIEGYSVAWYACKITPRHKIPKAEESSMVAVDFTPALVVVPLPPLKQPQGFMHHFQ